MTPSRRAWLERTVCLRKVRRSRRGAMAVAATARARGDRLSAYRCPFLGVSGRSHWHVGHAPGMRTLRAIAEILRDRHNGVPEPSTQTR